MPWHPISLTISRHVRLTLNSISAMEASIAFTSVYIAFCYIRNL